MFYAILLCVLSSSLEQMIPTVHPSLSEAYRNKLLSWPFNRRFAEFLGVVIANENRTPTAVITAPFSSVLSIDQHGKLIELSS